MVIQSQEKLKLFQSNSSSDDCHSMRWWRVEFVSSTWSISHSIGNRSLPRRAFGTFVKTVMPADTSLTSLRVSEPPIVLLSLSGDLIRVGVSSSIFFGGCFKHLEQQQYCCSIFRGHLPRYNHTRKMMRMIPATMPMPI